MIFELKKFAIFVHFALILDKGKIQHFGVLWWILAVFLQNFANKQKELEFDMIIMSYDYIYYIQSLILFNLMDLSILLIKWIDT